MILLLALALSASAIEGTPLGVLPPQSLPAVGCAAYLFTGGGDRKFVAMAGAEPGSLRVVLDGALVDVARAAQSGTGGYGFAATTEYRGATVSATLEMTTVARSDLTGGATIPLATLRIDRVGKDGVVVPLVGIIGCTT